MTATMAPWPEDAFRALEAAEVRQAAYVPDGGLSRLIELCQAGPGIAAVPLTTEAEGVALLAGAWLGGQRGVLMMQSSGIGNCVNALALTRTCRFPLLCLITMRGEWGEFNPWQVPMGQIGGEVLRLAGVLVHPVREPGQVGETVAAAARMAFHGPAAAAVLISQRVVGIKEFTK